MGFKGTAVVIGLGEIGKPILQLLSEAYDDKIHDNRIRGRDVEEPNWRFGGIPLKDPTFTFMHICFPESTTFLNEVATYVSMYSPENLIIHSTLSPGMTDKIGEYLWDTDGLPGIFYSPVRGNTRDGMIWGLKTYTKFFAPYRMTYLMAKDLISFTKDHLEKAGMNVQVINSAISLEYGKLFNLAYYAACISFFQGLERIVEAKSLNYDVIKQFISSTEEESEGKVPRPLYYGGYIGGHCVIQGVEKILAQNNMPLLEAILESNIKRYKERLFKP